LRAPHYRAIALCLARRVLDGITPVNGGKTHAAILRVAPASAWWCWQLIRGFSLVLMTRRVVNQVSGGTAATA